MKPIQDIETDDKLLRELMIKLPVEKAPENFTYGIMQQVYSGFEPIQETPEMRRQMLYGYIAVFAAIIIVGVMIFAQWPFFKINLFTETNFLKGLLSFSMGILGSINSITVYLKESSTLIIIMSSIGFLLIFERLIRRGFQQRSSFML
ncbi:MAG: hypothetical protein K0B15_09705 [Lentimicrobium sp.]|nr:hypothetical protein [Lentimicrobium sp.]